MLFRTRIFLDRLRNVGVLSKADAVAYSCTGPIARASGVTYDLRKDVPYLVYPDLDFEVPYAVEGDCWARFIVRMEEMRQSHSIITEALRKLPAGPVNVPIADKFPLPDKLTTYNSMEGLIQHFELIMSQPRCRYSRRDEIYAAVESPNGELGLLLVGDGSQTAWRVRTRPPSFIHFSVFPHIIKDYLLADVVAVLGSLNIIAAELDR